MDDATRKLEDAIARIRDLSRRSQGKLTIGQFVSAMMRRQIENAKAREEAAAKQVADWFRSRSDG